MIIIGNNCGSAFLYRHYKLEYNMPFIWSVIFADDYVNLIKNFDNINFTKYEMVKLTKEKDLSHHDLSKQPLGLYIDNCFTVYFTHYLYDEKCNTPTKIDSNVFYKRHSEYVKEKYDSRLIKMKESKETPIFLIVAYPFQGWTKEKLEALIKCNRKMIILSPIETNIKSTENVLYIYDKNLNTYPGPAINSKLKDVKNFIQKTIKKV